MKDYALVLTEKLDNILLEKFKKVVRGGKLIRKQVARVGFKMVKGKGGKIKQKRMSVAEKRKRHISSIRAWKKNKASRMNVTLRKRTISMRRRNAIFGVGK